MSTGDQMAATNSVHIKTSDTVRAKTVNGNVEFSTKTNGDTFNLRDPEDNTIGDQLSRLDKLLDTLKCNILDLKGEISPVLIPEDGRESGDRPEAIRTHSEVLNDILNKCEFVQGMNNEVRGIVGRVNL